MSHAQSAKRLPKILFYCCLFTCFSVANAEQLLAPNPIKFESARKFDRFGHASALSADGKTLFVGTGANQVFIYEKKPTGWKLTQQLDKPTNLQCKEDTGAYFGGAIALSANGKTALIGASSVLTLFFSGIPLHYHYFCAELPIYSKTGGRWVLQKLLTSPEIDIEDGFGASLALSANGKIALVGAEFTRCANVDDYCGAVYVFEKGPKGWGKRKRFLGEQPYDAALGYFGSATAIASQGKWGLIGARSGDSAWTIAKIQGNWQLLQKLNLAEEYKSRGFGSALGLSANGQRIVIGAEYASGPDYCTGSFVNQCGAAYAFKRTGSNYGLEAVLTAADSGDTYTFGESLALSNDGKRVVIGASGADCPTGNCGAAYFFTRSGTSWITQGRFTSPSAGTGGSELGGLFGMAITTNGNGRSVAVSADQEECTNGEDDCGAVYLYTPVYP